MGWCPKFSSLWPAPPLGDSEIRDQLKPEPYHTKPSVHQTIPRANRGGEFQGAYSMQNYASGMDHHLIPSLARGMLYTWSDAAYNVGGPRYPLDYGYGPGFHADCMTPQFYMRPGIPKGANASVAAGGRQF